MKSEKTEQREKRVPSVTIIHFSSSLLFFAMLSFFLLALLTLVSAGPVPIGPIMPPPAFSTGSMVNTNSCSYQHISPFASALSWISPDWGVVQFKDVGSHTMAPCRLCGVTTHQNILHYLFWSNGEFNATWVQKVTSCSECGRLNVLQTEMQDDEVLQKDVQVLPAVPRDHFFDWIVPEAWDHSPESVILPYVTPESDLATVTETDVLRVWQQPAASLTTHGIEQETVSFYQIQSTYESYIGVCKGFSEWVVA